MSDETKFMWTLLHGCFVDYSIACSLFTDPLFSLESPSSTLLKIKNRGDLLTASASG